MHASFLPSFFPIVRPTFNPPRNQSKLELPPQSKTIEMDSNMRFLYTLLFLTLTLFISSVASMEFQVGGNEGWVIPPSKHDQLYNDWASNNRFNINDTLHFVYKKDSVLEVTKDDYEKCQSVHPLFFSNNGNTVFTSSRPGLFYFISGVSGHCERGLKMIIKVLEPAAPPQPANQTTPTSAAIPAASFSPALVILFGAFFV